MLLKYLMLGVLVCGLASCDCKLNTKPETQSKSNDVAYADSVKTVEINRAVATIMPTKGNDVRGYVSFSKVDGGLLIVADIDGLSPGKHGFHVHELGDCSGDLAASAGAHFNPYHKKHGGPEDVERHAGDLGNLVADEKGHAHYRRIDKLLSLSGENSVISRSIIIHAAQDDLKTDPAGASGERIACGKIVAVVAEKVD